MNHGGFTISNVIDQQHKVMLQSITTKKAQKTVRAIGTHRFLFDIKYFARINTPEWMQANDTDVYYRIRNNKETTDLI